MMEKLHSQLVTALCLLIGCWILQVSCRSYELKYKPVIFDDQYIGCSEELNNDVMPRILSQEKSNRQFNTAWENATKWWQKVESRLDLPDGFEDEHGIALLVFTSQYPKGNPIYQQLNGNLTIAGTSRKAYMNKFHFKALHYYLTRALQILKPDCSETYMTYRGSHDTFRVHPVFKFGRFTSTSLNSSEALSFGQHSKFNITTCFGASIRNFSFFPDELEVLIPASEKFSYVKKEGAIYYLESTGQTCSYFNCAILGAEKLDNAICHPSVKSKARSVSSSLEEQEERITGLEKFLVRIDSTWELYVDEMYEYVMKMRQTQQSMEDFQEMISESKRRLLLTKSVLQAEKTAEDNIHLILSKSIIQLQEKVLALEAFIQKLATIFCIAVLWFTAVAGMKVYTFMKKVVMAIIAEAGMNNYLPNAGRE